MSEKETRYWGGRLGWGGKFVEHGRKGKYIAIGWNELGNLEWLADKERSWGEVRDELIKKYKDIHRKASEIQVGQASGQVLKFVREMKEEDIVVIPDMARGRALIGRVTGSYEYKADWADGCSYLQRRDVEWIKEVKRDAIPIKLKTSLGSLLTVFSLDRRRQEIMSLTGPPPVGEPPVIVTGNELAKVIISRLFNLAPEKFEHFVTHLLTLVGFEATATRYTIDRGVDVIGTLNPEGLADVTLKAQVKRVNKHIGNKDILLLRGTLGADEHGVLITTGGFTKQAQAEAEAEGKRPIALIDGEMLVELILTHYDELNEEYKELLHLRRREVPLRERFHTIKGT